jgi:hypothetical protein
VAAGREALTSFFVAADVMLVMPVRDGMNLVALLSADRRRSGPAATRGPAARDRRITYRLAIEADPAYIMEA